VLPVDGEVALLVSLPHAGLPIRHTPHRSLQGDPVVPPATDQQCRIDIARVHEMLGREEALGG
jgi:hypothetical protein